MPTKKGRLSREEEQYILANAGSMSAEDIALELNRTKQTVKSYIRLKYVPLRKPEQINPPVPKEVLVQNTIKAELRSSQEWKRLKNEFSNEELLLFEEKFIRLCTQFRDDILPSEETQIMQAIKLEILLSRNLIERKKAIEDIGVIEKMQTDLILKCGGTTANMQPQDREYLTSLEVKLQTAKSAEQARTTEYTKLHERHSKMMDSLKATRDQRVKDIESNHKDFIGLLKSLQKEEVNTVVGRQMELMKLATDKEYDRLGQIHTYDDGMEDRPILSAETVMDDEDVE